MRYLILLAAAALMVTGCVTPQVSSSPNVIDRSYAANVDSHQVLAGLQSPMRLDIRVRSYSMIEQKVRIKVDWFDATGMRINTVLSRWEPLTISGQEIRVISKVAPSEQATTYTITLEDTR
jgi:uncharacterized protein YcfL